MNQRLLGVTLLVTSILFGAAYVPSVPAQQTAPQVPAEYAQLYSTLQTQLDNYSAYLSSIDTHAHYPVIFGTELLAANGNRGTALLAPGTLQGVILYLNRLQEMGIRGVTVEIGYPLYTPSFPNYQNYVQFYKQVAQEVRNRGMKLNVESSVMFANTPFSGVTFNYASIPWTQFEAERKQMLQTIIQDLQPDYLNFGAEPDTEYKLTGYTQFNSPDQYVAYVNYILTGLNRGQTLVGSGVGTWGNLQYAQDDAANTTLDYIVTHVYPIVGQASMQQILTIANIAKQHNKRVVLDEAWLSKADTLQPTSIADLTTLYGLDTFSFWAPLDQKFLANIVKSAQITNIEYISPFWSTYFFSYLDYNSTTSQASYDQLRQMDNQQAYANVLADQFSSTGRYYAQLAGASLPESKMQQASTNSTSPSTNKTWSIPGFPLESILAGLAVGFVLLCVIGRRKTFGRPKPTSLSGW